MLLKFESISVCIAEICMDVEVVAAGKHVVEQVVDLHVKQVRHSYTPLPPTSRQLCHQHLGRFLKEVR